MTKCLDQKFYLHCNTENLNLKNEKMSFNTLTELDAVFKPWNNANWTVGYRTTPGNWPVDLDCSGCSSELFSYIYFIFATKHNLYDIIYLMGHNYFFLIFWDLVSTYCLHNEQFLFLCGSHFMIQIFFHFAIKHLGDWHMSDCDWFM